MSRFPVCLGLAAFVIAGLANTSALAQKKKLEVTKLASGSVADEELRKDAPEVITSAKGLAKVWHAWKIEGKMPKIDFNKVLVVAVYGAGSRLNLAGATLDEKGNLQVLGMGTLDLAPGFRYVLGTVSKEGIKTVNGKNLPAE
jgi:hypothetical protein